MAPGSRSAEKRKLAVRDVEEQQQHVSSSAFATPIQPRPPSTDLFATPRALHLTDSMLPTPPYMLPQQQLPQEQQGLIAAALAGVLCKPQQQPPRSTLAKLNDFLECSYKLQDRARQLLMEEQHELRRGMELNIFCSTSSDGSHHSQHCARQQENEDPSCVTPSAQVMHDLGPDHSLFSPASAKMDPIFGHLGSTPTFGQLGDHASNALLSPTAVGLHSYLQDDGSARCFQPGSSHAPFSTHRPHPHSQFHPLSSKLPPSSACTTPTLTDTHPGLATSPRMPPSPTTQRYWQPLSGLNTNSTSSTAPPTLRCPPAHPLSLSLPLGARSPLSREQHHTPNGSFSAKASRGGLHTQPGSAQHTLPHAPVLCAELSPRCGLRGGGFGGLEGRSLRQALLQQSLECSAADSPTASLLPRSGKLHELLSCPGSPGDYLLSEPNSSRHPFQQPQQAQLDFLGGNAHSNLRPVCTTPHTKRQRR